MLPWKPEELRCPTVQRLKRTAVLSRRGVVSMQGKVVTIKLPSFRLGRCAADGPTYMHSAIAYQGYRLKHELGL